MAAAPTTLRDLEESDIRELLQSAEAWLASSDSDAALRELAKKMQDAEAEYEGADRLDSVLLREPMTI